MAPPPGALPGRVARAATSGGRGQPANRAHATKEATPKRSADRDIMARAQPRPRNAGDHLRSDHETQQSPFVVGYRLKWCSPPLPRTPSQQPVCATFGAKTRLRSESFARSFTDSGCIIEGTTLRCRALRISPTNEDVGQFSFTGASGITTSAASEHVCRSGTASTGSPSFAATERATSASYSRLGAWVSAPSFFGNAASGAIRSVLATYYV